MQHTKLLIGVGVLVALLVTAGVLLTHQTKSSALGLTTSPTLHPVSTGLPAAASPAPVAATISFVGPRQGIPTDAPVAYGFWDFAVPVPGVLARSGQPLISEFTWLKQQGYKSVVNFRLPGEYGDAADDSKLPGFTNLGLSYVSIPMADGAAPSTEQAQQFLDFVTNPVNQPVEIHCRGGYGRTGTFTALYRYSVQQWPIDKAIAESRLFHGGVDSGQEKFLRSWATAHPHQG